MDPRVKAGVSRSMVQLVISLVVLFLLRLLVGALPVLSDSGPVPGFDVSALVLAKAVVDTLMLVAVLAFGGQLSNQIRATRPTVRDLHLIVYLTIVVIVIGIAYAVYEDVAFGLFDGDLTLYSWIFLIAILAPLGYLAFLVFQNLEPITDVVLSRGILDPVGPAEDRNTQCPECGTNVGADEKFCTSCGTDVATARKRAQSRPDDRSCPSCGTGNAPRDRFCRSCGSSLEDVAKEGSKSKGTCFACGGENSPEARFCRHCGAKMASSSPSA